MPRADHPGAGVACGVPGGCCGESVGGLGEVVAEYREVEQGLPGIPGEEGSVVVAQEWRVVGRGGLREVILGGADRGQGLADPARWRIPAKQRGQEMLDEDLQPRDAERYSALLWSAVQS